jgi:hemerythrin-like metal-binding protein
MSKIQWDKSFSVNDDVLDNQHQKWFDTLNRLHEAMLEGDSDELVQAKCDSLQAMIDYTKLHFRTEEAHMRRIGYPGLDAHMQQHKAFVEQLDELSVDYRAGRVLLGTRMIKVMQEWLRDHISEEDRKYAAHAH